MGKMCGPIGERHGRDVWSNRREAWERCVVQSKRGMGEMCAPERGMGEMCGPIGERHGRDVWSNRREAWERCVVQ